MKVRAIWILCALALGSAGFVLAGCGGDKKTVTETVTVTEAADTSDTEAMTDTAMSETDTAMSETDTAMTETDTAMTATDETDTTATDETDTGLSAFATSENCREFLNFASSVATALSGTGDTDVQEAADAMQKFADEAPDEIRDDFQVLADAYEKIADALKGVDLSSETPPADAIAKLAQLSQEIDSAALTEASQNISEWTQENCSIGG